MVKTPTKQSLLKLQELKVPVHFLTFEKSPQINQLKTIKNITFCQIFLTNRFISLQSTSTSPRVAFWDKNYTL
jgi:hypothetical protein